MTIDRRALLAAVPALALSGAAFAQGADAEGACLVGPGEDLLEGVIGATYLPTVDDTSNPWIQLFKKVNTDFNKGVDFDGNVLYGMSVGYLFVQALQKAGVTVLNATRGSQLPGFTMVSLDEALHGVAA